MSGERVSAFFQKRKLPKMEECLAVESDRRLYSCMSTGALAGWALAAYVLTIQFIIPPVLVDPKTTCHLCDPDKPESPFTMIAPKDYHGPIHPKIVKHPPTTTAHQAPKPKSKDPVKVAGTMVQRLISSQTDRTDFSAYDLIGKTMKNLDLDKLSKVAVLTRTGETRLSGRPGIQSTGFDMGYYLDGTGGDGIPEVRLPGRNLGRIPPRIRSGQDIGKVTAIDATLSETTRSSAQILAVIRSHSPGLRHIYNSYLRTNPGMQGKVILRFAIAPSGQVVDVGLAGSSTEAPEFDAKVVEAVLAWRFEAVKAIGNDLVTVPFNFSE